MFPGPHAHIIRNDDGEVLGWENPYEPDPYDRYDEIDDREDDDFYPYGRDDDDDDTEPDDDVEGYAHQLGISPTDE